MQAKRRSKKPSGCAAPKKAKRAPTAYNLYIKDQLPLWKAEHQGADPAEALSAVAASWKYAPENPIAIKRAPKKKTVTIASLPSARSSAAGAPSSSPRRLLSKAEAASAAAAPPEMVRCMLCPPRGLCAGCEAEAEAAGGAADEERRPANYDSYSDDESDCDDGVGALSASDSDDDF